ncbi:MAG: DNA recombination protein RmuC [Christensenellaceae bacterium]|nr:DNA recombination protein RmuC [Christensenellaceae bacterium]MDD6360630.1 DNA recombination protein RmuC [Christensenellaceae bacterium]
MEAISIVAVCLGALSVVLSAVIVALTVRKNKTADASVEIGREIVDSLKSEIAREGQAVRESVSAVAGVQNTSIQNALNANREVITSAVKTESERSDRLQTGVTEGFATVANELKSALKELNDNNEKQLEKMRQTVDEKLNENLEQRFQKSFRMVSERLDAITKGFGEMQNLTNGMSDLKRVLTNVKTRGTWGESSLEYLLSQLLAPEQYEKNVAIAKTESGDRVDFVINLPGKSSEKVWLPVDAKFPVEDYNRIIDADNDVSAEDARRALATRLRTEAVSIKNKYIKVPKTTDFAIMYLPVEGLFAEAMQIRGLADEFQNKYRVVMCGPTTLAALLNSLQMGFRSVQIEKRSSEIYKLLGAFKADFETFCAIIEKTHKKLNEATQEIERAGDRTRKIQKKLDRIQIDDPSYAQLTEGAENEA